MEHFKDQVLLSTNVDSQGEKLTKEELNSIFRDMEGKRIPIGQAHDASQPYVGYFKNARIVEDPNNKNEYNIIADVYCDPSKLTTILGGLSYSALQEIYRTNQDPLIAIYVPFPYYNDKNFISSFTDENFPLLVGKWKQKAADPYTVAIISTVVTIVLTPIWNQIYNEKFAPYLDKLLDNNKLNSKLKYDVVIKSEDESGNKFHLYFISNRDDLKSIRSYIIQTGISSVKTYLENSEKAKTVGIAMVRLKYNNDYSRYDILNVTFKDGTVEDHSEKN